MVTCLMGAKVTDLTRYLDRFLVNSGLGPMVIIHMGFQ